MEKRKYNFVTADAPPDESAAYAGDPVEVPARDEDTLARIEAKLDAYLAATGAEVEGHGSRD